MYDNSNLLQELLHEKSGNLITSILHCIQELLVLLIYTHIQQRNLMCTMGDKMCYVILDYNSYVSWWIFSLFVSMLTENDTLQYAYLMA